MANLVLEGVRQNNLKDIDIELPLGKTIVFTGPSGSGKSSLAFETIYAEGQRRYMQSLSTYARQFLEKFRAPDVEKISNIPPTIALEQFNPVRNSRATVGTTTEIYDYLRLLFGKLGLEYCATCDLPMERRSLPQIFSDLAAAYAGQTILFAFQKTLPASAEAAQDLMKEYLRNGFSRVLYKTEVLTVDDFLKGKIPTGKDVHLVLDRVRMPETAPEEVQTRVTESIGTAMEMGKGIAHILVEGVKGWKSAEEVTTQNRCPKCHELAQPKGANVFSFNSPLGACQTCKGFGNTLEVDEELVIPNANLSLARGAIDPFMKPSLRQWQKKLLEYCKNNRIDADLPYRELPAEHKKLVFNGDKKFKGVRGVFRMLEEEKYKLRIRVFVSRYTSPFTCNTCNGTRLNPTALRVRIAGKNIAEICGMTLGDVQTFLQEAKFSKRDREIAVDILRQIERRLSYLVTVGLNYLTLSRLSRSLSGGEYQRILLATQLSQGLTDTMYVLDEPSIGLHPKDTNQLLKVLSQLRSQGNSLILVEHDPEVIEWGEYIVDMGPGSGSRGGEVVFAGSKERFSVSDCTTAQAVRTWKEECRRLQSKSQTKKPDQWLEIKGAAGNNLKNVDVNVPLKSLVAVTGVSGSGKSTLVVDTLFNALSKIFHGKSEKISRFGSMSGFEFLSGVELVDQSPIGKSSRSNPITFIKGYDEVRALFAQTRDAVAKKFTPGHFSFNVAGGRCEECEGEGRVSVDMVFMEDVWIPCQVCDQKRFKPAILNIKVRGKNIDDVLRMTVEEAFTFFAGTPSLRSKLALLAEVGLGYLQLGQPGYTLSGGEAQRLKIARELAATSVRRPATLFILDEPTTGLHFNEITRLIHVLRRLISDGHSVIVIEHNLQMICAADYLVDLGPDGGDQGGAVVAVGTPMELAQKHLPHTGRYLAEILQG